MLLITACDVGTANYLAPVLPMLNCPWKAFAQPRAAAVWDGLRIAHTLIEDSAPQTLTNTAEDIFRRDRYGALLAGTSWGMTIDKAATLAARAQGLPSAAVVEHWGLYRERFSDVSDGRIVRADAYLPDWIWLNDEDAIAAAAAAGLPEDRLRALGQPHLERQRAALARRSETPDDGSVVFISERIRSDFPAGSDLDMGFDEHLALQGLLEALPEGAELTIKLHPQETPDKYDYLKNRGMRAEIVQVCDLEQLILKAGTLVGMVSMVLLEAALVRDDVVSFMPGGRPEDFIGNELGATTAITTTEALAKRLSAPAMNKRAAASFGERFDGSNDRVARAAEALL